MLRKEDFAVIEALNKRGVYLKDIAVELEVNPRTVKRALQRGGAPKAERSVGPSKLDPYKAKVDELLGEGVWNSQVILREIQALGYEGGSTMLRLYIQPSGRYGVDEPRCGSRPNRVSSCRATGVKSL